MDLHLGEDRTLVEVFWGNVERYATRPALRRRAADGADGPADGWEVLTWAEYGTEVRRLAAGLVHLGLQPGDRVALLCSNRREWHLVDMAVLSVGGATVPVYPTSSSSQVAYVLTDAGCRIAVVEDNDQLAKVLLRRDELGGVEKVVVVDGVEGLDHAFVLDLEHLAAVGDDLLDESPTVVDDRRAALRPDDLATIVYTSGTTGHPKGVTLLHRNLAENLRNITAVVAIGPEDRFLSFLPLSHIAERTVSHFGQVVSGGETWFAQSLASVPEDIQACRPTIFFAVPRVWEKFREGIREKVERSPAPRRVLAERYLALAARGAGVTGAGAPLGLPEKLQLKALDAIAGRAIRSGLGLDQVWYLVSGAAPVHPDLLRWFQGLGLPIAEVYGQTEDCGVTTLNPPGAIRIGTVGPPVPGVELQIADDGEVLVRGGHVTPGYHCNPEATAELLDVAGWMHTGDLGELDTEGYLRITGRKKDLIINAAGKNISPQEIETRLRFEPLISQAVVIGDGRAYLTALLTLDVDAVHEWAGRHGRVFPDVESMTTDPALRDEVDESVERVNAEHARVEGIKRWTLLPRDLSIATGELTPTLKVKRQVVAQQHEDLIEAMYQR